MADDSIAFNPEDAFARIRNQNPDAPPLEAGFWMFDALTAGRLYEAKRAGLGPHDARAAFKIAAGCVLLHVQLTELNAALGELASANLKLHGAGIVDTDAPTLCDRIQLLTDQRDAAQREALQLQQDIVEVACELVSEEDDSHPATLIKEIQRLRDLAGKTVDAMVDREMLDTFERERDEAQREIERMNEAAKHLNEMYLRQVESAERVAQGALQMRDQIREKLTAAILDANEQRAKVARFEARLALLEKDGPRG